MTEQSPAERIFFAALERHDPAERVAFLDAACAGQPALRARVEMLLAAQPHVGAFLEPPAATGADAPEPPEKRPPASTADFPGRDEHVGAVLAGKYKLIEAIGEGGMGQVFMALQTEPVKRAVAVKVIKAGMDSKAVLTRFEAERQALAMMDHPNIAKVLDAGTTGEPGSVSAGRPFFVMELVKGLPITKFCDERRLTPRQRLELFVPVCQAIQHAHQKGVIHRDIKPSNVLVAMYDDRPVPKVIDFGVAKAAGQTLTDKTLMTGFGAVVGTPEYMSPEQASMNMLDIDTRSDVYSLGVLLYELLTGSTPVDRKSLGQAAVFEILRIVREVEAPKPSAKLSTLDTLPSVAANRGTEPAKLSKLMKGELDWVVLKALEKDRSRRYDTANGLARDLQRYLADEVVEARPPSTGYRIKKFVRRHKGQVIAASLVALALVCGIVGTTFGLIEARRQEQLAIAAAAREAERADGERQARLAAEEQRKKAQAKEAEANAVVKFFQDKVFAAARPKGQDGGLGKEVSLRDAIVASLPALGQGFAAQPLVEARLRLALGITFHYLAEYEQARDQYEQARALFARLLGPDHRDTLTSMNNLANSYAALNRSAEALKLREEVLEIQKRVLPQDDPDTLRSMNNLANSYAALNRFAEALKLREEVLEIRRRVLPKDHPETLQSMNNLAVSYAALNRPAEALKLREEVLAIQKRVLPKDHPETLQSMNNLAVSYAALNRPAEALKLREEVLEIQKRVLPKDHPETLASMINLANSYKALNRPAEHLNLREEVLEIQKRVLPKDHRDTLATMFLLALNYAVLNRPAEALTLFEEVLAIQKRVLPKDHPDTLRSIWALAETLSKLDRGAEAIPHIDECVAKAAGQAVDPRLIPTVMVLRMRHFQKAGDPAGCRATATMWEKLNRPDAVSLYTAACFRAVTAGVQAKTPEADAAKLAKEDADRALGWLTKALDAGFKDAAHLKKDADLDPLREREDFKKLMAEVEADSATPSGASPKPSGPVK